MKDEKLTPKIRFKGFTDPWEQRKLYEMVNHVTRKNTKLQSTLPLTISARYGLVDQNDFFNKQVASRDVSGYYLIENGEFAYNKSYSKGYPVGTIKRLDRYSEGVLSTLYILFKPVHISSQFLVAYFEGNMWHQEVARRATEGARNHGLLNIAPKDFFEMRLVVPSHREQDMIGKSLQSLDNLIAANEEKVSELKILKKLLMQRIFNQRWRFKGFTDPWEQRKLSRYLEVSSSKNLDEEYNKNDVLSVSGNSGVVNQIRFQGRSFAGKSVKNYSILRTNDVVYTKSPLKLNPYGIVKTNLGSTGIVSTLYAIYIPKSTLFSPFIQYYFDLDSKTNNYLRPLVNKGAKNDMKVRNDDVLKGQVIFPHEVDEQKHIVVLLNKLENAIAANEEKCEQLKKLKKYLMQNMFV